MSFCLPQHFHTAQYYIDAGFKVFDFYILSDDEIKEGDWFLDLNNKKSALVILQNGNTGIGTSTPTNLLHGSVLKSV